MGSAGSLSHYRRFASIFRPKLPATGVGSRDRRDGPISTVGGLPPAGKDLL